MPILNNITVALDSLDTLNKVAARALSVGEGDILDVTIRRRALDARGRRAPRWVLSLDVRLHGEPPPSTSALPAPACVRKRTSPVVIVGAGPAGLFAALRLVENGITPILLERGGALKQRHGRARLLRSKGVLDPESNLCFGEGGAGAYSDGKLYTRKRSPMVQEIYRRLVEFGGHPSILVDAHPHIGTNRLIPVINNLHDYLEAKGVDMRFQQRLDDIVVQDGQLQSLRIGNEEITTDTVILATGHSARATYEMLAKRGVHMVSKPFAVGARVEHPQSWIDSAQFGRHAGHPDLGAAEYFLRCQQDGRGIYSFCMCPGGFIIPTPTEPGHLNVNGMSNEARKNYFGNAALVVTVAPEDFAPSGNPLDGLAYQRMIEKRTFEEGGSTYEAPATRLTDFVEGRASTTLPARTSYRPGLVASNIATVLPKPLIRPLQLGIKQFNRRMKGYLSDEAVIVASETTTSSPIRLERDESYQSITVRGLFPAGEGAGYSGGIASSAIDGIRIADSILSMP